MKTKMNKIDEQILRGKFPVEPAADCNPAAPGQSYYWDARAEGLTHGQAVRRAAAYMRGAVASLASLQR